MPERVAVEVGRSGGSPVGSQCDAVEEAAVVAVFDGTADSVLTAANFSMI